MSGELRLFCTINALLVARAENPLLEKRRSSYDPTGRSSESLNEQDPKLWGTFGVLEQLP
jgi:hypothetical protein